MVALAQPKGLIHGGPLSDFTRSVAGPLHLGNKTTSASLVANYLGSQTPVKSEEQANAILTTFLQFLLDQNRYVDAATLLWAPSLFSGEPRSVKMLWDAVFQNVAVAVPGAASMGKSYSLGVWCYLDWRRDPDFTNIQIVGPSEKHLERNLFSHLVKLHNQASIKGPGEVRQLEITSDPHQKDSGLFGVVVPIGKKASGRLQGVKVVQRTKPHHQFGVLSRLRVMLEEAENIPAGIFDDVTNIISNAIGIEQFKIFAPFNPKDPNSACAQRVEPLDGWGSIDVETSETWDSKRGWKVVRLDAYKSENVLAGQTIFQGMQTKEGLEKSILNAGGVGTPGYYTMARGWYPPQGVDLAVVPQHLTNDLFGEYTFVSAPQSIGSVDTALEGGDNAIFALGRIGRASGWKKPAGTLQKEAVVLPFKDQHGNPVIRTVVQLDQLFALPKGDTVKLVEEIRRVCAGAYVKGDHLGVDRTGNGAGVHDILVRVMSTQVRGINGSQAPTERKILEEDQQLPCDEYAYLVSELWFAARKFIEFGFLKISPKVPVDPVVQELTGRRFLLTQKKTKVESKKDYRSRGNPSPDRADAITMLVHVARLLMPEVPSATGNREGFEYDTPSGPAVQRIGCTDRMDVLPPD
jgi:hypothetical protein